MFIMSLGCAFKAPVKWIRFKNFVEDYFYMETEYKDAVIFKPKVEVVFYGFGLFTNYHNKDVTYKIQIAFDSDQPCEEIEL
jgi:hypothetical protein